ncbi:MAG: ABC transporter permease [Firmicutes bacterium]|nr:ABC transporter permease [Bacillota bacterium]
MLSIQRVIALARRSIRLFLRDRMAVFFSFLSTLILVALYFLFIAQMFVRGMTDAGFPLSGGAQNFLIYLQMMAGVMILNSMSLSNGVFSTIADDFKSRRVDSLLLTRAHSSELLLSQYISGLFVSFALNLLTWAAAFFLIGLLTGYWVTAGAFFAVAGILAIASLISAALMSLITALVKSPAALGVIGSLAGTFLGFLCGIYIPYSNLGKTTQAVGSVLPFTHLVIWLKRTVLTDAFHVLNVPADQANTLLSQDFFSAKSIGFLGLDVPLWGMLIFCGVFALVCFGLAWRILSRRIRGSR